MIALAFLHRGGLFALALSLVAVLAVTLSGATPAAANPLDIREVRTPKGIKLWLVEEPSVPMVALSFSFRGGAALDPENRSGVANMVSGLLDEGAGDIRSTAFQNRLADLAVEMRFDAGRDSFDGSLKTLAENADEAFDLLGLALAKPRFDADAVERIRGQIAVNISRKADDPQYLASHALFEEAFGEHPYGRPVDGTADSLSSITRDDLAAFARRQFTRDRLRVAVVGSLDADKLAALVDRAFAALPEDGSDIEAASTAAMTTGETVIRRDFPQSVIAFGLPGLTRDDPDWYAALVMNHILGGGSFESRLFQEVRVKRGLAYGVSTYLYPLDGAGLWLGWTATRNEKVADTLDIIRREYKRMAEKGVTAEELEAAKTYLTGSFPLRLESNSGIARLMVAMQIADLPRDYIDRYDEIIGAVTREDVMRVAKRLIDPSRLGIVIVGDPQDT